MRLTSHAGCREHIHSLLTSQEVNLGFLPPGDYLLTLCRPQGRQNLWVHLSPGSNVECRFSHSTEQWCWRQLPGHCGYNLTGT